MNIIEQRRLRLIEQRFEATITRLADSRMERLARDWRRQKGGKLKISFGMGQEFVRVDGVDIDEYPPLIADAIKDIEEITDGHRRGVPDDVEI